MHSRCPELVVGAAVVVVEERLFQVRHDAPAASGPGWNGIARSSSRMSRRPSQIDLLGGRVVADLLGVLGVQEQGPEHVQLHRPALAGLVVVAVGRARRRARCAVRCGGRSRAARVCTSPANELPTMPTRPFDQRLARRSTRPCRSRRVPSCSLATWKYSPAPLGAVAAAQVLQHGDVAARREEVGDLDVAPVGLVVGGAAEDRRETAPAAARRLGPAGRCRSPGGCRRASGP